MTDLLLQTLLPQMVQAQFYPHAVQEPIEVIQTHISYIILTGHYAYKLKKPVDFGFLNYSTLAQRKHFSEEELRLNQRTAPELYLNVVTITQQGDRFALEGDGRPVEYAVKMKQFPKGQLFSDLLANNQLTPARMEQLAHELVKLHRHAASDAYIRRFGTVDQIRVAIDENYTQGRAYIGRGQTQQQFEETQAYTNRAFAEWGDRFQSRLDHNKIRECHGDCHLGNVCLWGDRVLLFDCIEFNQSFRFVDTMYDVAFVVMDCDAQGHSDLGNIFLNTYLEESGDWAGLGVLPLYLSRQSYVRAKVTSFFLDDPNLGDEAKPEVQVKASRYYHLAWQYTQPRSGRLILMSGLSGSGKSTIARQLAQRMGAIQLRSDAVRKHLAGVSLRQKGNDSLYSPEMSRKTYGKLLRLGLQLAGWGQTVILDAKYDRVALREAPLYQAHIAHFPISILACEAPIPVLKQRIQSRNNDISDATVDLISAQQSAAEGFTAIEQTFVTHIDTSQPEVSQNLQRFIDLLN